MSMKELDCITQVYLDCMILSLFSLTPVKWRLLEPFIAQGRTVTMSFKARQVASGQVKPYIIGHNG
jgi:hypothetical protein